MSYSVTFLRLGDTDFFVPDEPAYEGRRKIDVLNCTQQCLPTMIADKNHPAIHTDECNLARFIIQKGKRESYCVFLSDFT